MDKSRNRSGASEWRSQKAEQTDAGVVSPDGGRGERDEDLTVSSAPERMLGVGPDAILFILLPASAHHAK